MKLLAALVSSSILLSYAAFSQENSEMLLLDLYEKQQYNLVISSADSILDNDKSANQARISHIKADAYYFLNNVEKSLEHYLMAIDLASRHPLTMEQRLECFSHAGFCYKYLGQYLEAIPYYEIAYRLSTTLNDSVEIANQTSNLGSLYSKLGNYKKAQAYFNTAYQIDFALNDTTALAYDLVALGELMLDLGDTETAIRYLKEGIKVKKTIAGDHTTHILRLGKLSSAYLLAGKLDSASIYSQMAINHAVDIGDSLSLYKQYITEAGIFNAKKDYREAQNKAMLAFNYFDTEDNRFQVTSAFELAEAFIGLKQYQRANRLLTEVLEISLQNNLLEQSSAIYERRARLHERMGNTSAALGDYKNFQLVKDSLQRLDKQNAILILDQEYQTSQKQQQIELLEAKNQVSQLELAKRRRDNTVLVILLVSIVAIASYIYYTIRRKNQLKNQLLTSQVNELRLQIRALMEGSPEDIKLELEALNSSIQEPLSDREFEILSFAISDLSNTEIADKTFVSVNTVKYHLKNIYAKLGVSNRREALKFAFQNTSN